MPPDASARAASRRPTRRRPSYETVLRRLRADIIAGRYAQGAPLRLAELARRFGTSPMPVREALHRLASEDLVVMHPRRGAVVRTLDARTVRGYFEFAGVIVAAATRKAVARLPPGELPRLERLVARMDDNLAREAPDVVLHNRLNRRFHDRILAFCDNPRFLQALQAQEALRGLVVRQVVYSPARLRQANAEHRELLDALRRGDAAAAEALILRQHENALADVLATLPDADGAPPSGRDDDAEEG